MEYNATVLGSNIQQLRKEKGLTQEQLAKQLHVSFQTISKWETGKSVPDALILPSLAKIFDCSIDRLFSYDNQTKIYHKIPEEFILLWQLAEGRLKQMGESVAQKQVIVLLTAGERRVFSFVNDLQNPQDEAKILTQVRAFGETVRRILCMWVSGQVDLPSCDFRKGLLEVNPENGQAEILLLGTNGYQARVLSATMPPAKR